MKIVGICALFLAVFSLDIEDFGAKSDDDSLEAALLNGKALNSAILSANSGSDKIVRISSGKVYFMIPNGLLANLENLKIQLDGRINTWIGPKEYWPVDNKGSMLALISIVNSKGLMIQGHGVIDGQAYTTWWRTIFLPEKHRPILLQIGHSVNTLIEGITLKNGSRCHIDLFDVLQISLQNIEIHNDITDNKDFFIDIPKFYLNANGIDVCGKDIIFKNIKIQSFDDAIVIKPTMANNNNYTSCTENLLIEDINIKFTDGITIRSFPPHKNENCIRNVLIRNVKFYDPMLAISVYSDQGTEGTGIISNVVYENIEIHNALGWAMWIGPHRPDHSGRYETGCSIDTPLAFKYFCPINSLVTIEKIALKNVTFFGWIFLPGTINCNITNPCTNFSFDRVNAHENAYFPVQKEIYCNNLEGVTVNSGLYPSCLSYLKE